MIVQCNAGFLYFKGLRFTGPGVHYGLAVSLPEEALACSHRFGFPFNPCMCEGAWKLSLQSSWSPRGMGLLNPGFDGAIVLRNHADGCVSHIIINRTAWWTFPKPYVPKSPKHEPHHQPHESRCKS